MEDKERTLFCGNLSDRVTEDLLYELFLQAGPLESVKIPKEKDGRPKTFGFITFKHPVSVPYSIALMNGIALYGKQLRLNPRNGSESTHNPYMEQLQMYHDSVSRQSHLRNDSDRGQRRDSRRYEPRTEGGRFDSRNEGGRYDSRSPAMHGSYKPQYMPPHNVPQGYPTNYGMQPHQNQWNRQFR